MSYRCPCPTRTHLIRNVSMLHSPQLICNKLIDPYINLLIHLFILVDEREV
jgi:hypothetical protein